MKTPTFWEGVGIALMAGVFGSIGYTALALGFRDGLAIRLLMAGLGLAYVLYLLARSQQRLGRATVVLAWLVLDSGLWLFWPSLPWFFMWQVLAIWLVRSLYFYASLLSAFADLALCSFSIATAYWAFSHTGSLFISLWCFFLLQALFVSIPGGKKRPVSEQTHKTEFNRAYQAADAAVRKLSNY